jgi:hypothetical protein
MPGKNGSPGAASGLTGRTTGHTAMPRYEWHGAANNGFGIATDGFEAVNNRFGAVNNGFEAANSRFEAANNGSETADKGFAVASDRSGTANNRFGIASNGFRAVNNKFEDAKDRYQVARIGKVAVECIWRMCSPKGTVLAIDNFHPWSGGGCRSQCCSSRWISGTGVR